MEDHTREEGFIASQESDFELPANESSNEKDGLAGDIENSEYYGGDDLPEPSQLSSSRSEASEEELRDGRVGEPRLSNNEAVLSQQPDHGNIDDAYTPDSLETLDWVKLQARFEQRMHEKCQEEQDLLNEFHSLTQFYNIWAQTPASQEQAHASKRLRTRIAYVQHQEVELENKQNHYSNVVQAFENALQLLRRA